MALIVAAVQLFAACANGPDARRGTAAADPPGSEATSSPTATSTTATPTPTTGTLPTSTPVQVRLDHYAIEPAATTAPAGTVALTAFNADRVPHDVVLLRTALSADELPTSGVRLDETDPSIEVLARTSRLAAGANGSLTATLPAGTYILVCTVPHHYVREAMVAALTVNG